jgi:DNA-binding protein HU-beta
MSKAALVEAVRKATECTTAQANDAVDGMVEVIAKTVKKEGSFALVGFGTFKSAKRAARTGRNPKTGEAIQIAASKTVRFKPSSQLKGRM